MSNHLIQLRKELHRAPELSGKESSTAARIVKELKKCRPDEILEGVGGTGIVAIFRAKREKGKKTILFRAELDAIAVQEETGVPYQSNNKGVMHGCGHDGHMAILIGLGHHLKENPPENIDVVLLFQPAEETGEGAEKVLLDRRFQMLKIDHGFALHNIPDYEEGLVWIKTGVFAVASTGVEITFKGRSSHAAYPDQGLNPSLQIAGLIQLAEEKLKNFKESDSLNKSVNTFIRLGSPAYGISPGLGHLGFTLRSPSDESLNEAVKSLKNAVDQIADSFKGSVKVQLVEPFAATINNDYGVELVIDSAKKAGIEVNELDTPFPWSEDFGTFREKCPITIFGLGSGVDSAPLHSENFNFNDKLIPIGVELFSGILELIDDQ